MITIDEFRKIELKVATVKSAEPHPNADRLMVLNVDLGSEERQIWKPPSFAAWRVRECFWQRRTKAA